MLTLKSPVTIITIILVNNPRTILLSEVGIPLLDQVRYHLPVIGVIDQPCKLNNVRSIP
jgi:hypothetical protein